VSQCSTGRLRMAICAASFSIAGPTTGFAHTSERGHIMLLPTDLYILGGTLSVVASVGLMALLPVLPLRRRPTVSVDLFPIAPLHRAMPSLASLVLLLVLAAVGIWGPYDPIANPLPGAVWSLWWTGFTVLCLFAGNLWAAINPWTGLHELLGSKPRLRLPDAIGVWPAVVLFLVFAWFELVYTTPSDPARLAFVVLIYLLFNFAGLFLFGRVWLRSVECFSVYFAMVARLSPVQWLEKHGRLILSLGLPGAALLGPESTVPGRQAFVLLALSTVSFDGFMRSFFWNGLIGVNPLEFPGRSAVILPNSIGLLGMFLTLAAAYALAIWLGRILFGLARLPGLVWSIAPIALAYHLAHYLPDLPVSLLHLVRALGDPFGTGLDLLGTAAIRPPASIMMDHEVAALVFRLQTAIIVAGHVMAVAAAHIIVLRATGSARQAVLGLLPLNLLMVGYTMFGLWLLATPVAG